MGKLSLKERAREWIAGIGWWLFLWGNKNTAEEYWRRIVEQERETLSVLVGLYHAVDDLLYHSASNSYPDDHHNPDHLAALRAVFLGMSVEEEEQ